MTCRWNGTTLYTNTSKCFYVVIYMRGPGGVGPAAAGPDAAGSGGGGGAAAAAAAAAAAWFFCTRTSVFPGLIPNT